MTLDSSTAIAPRSVDNVTYPGAQFAVPPSPDSGDLAGKNDWAERLDSFLQLQDGWDGYRAPRPSEHAIARALMLVGALGSVFDDCEVEIAPFLDGGITISIEHPRGHWLDLTIENDRMMSVERSDEPGGRAKVMDLERHLMWLLRN